MRASPPSSLFRIRPVAASSLSPSALRLPPALAKTILESSEESSTIPQEGRQQQQQKLPTVAERLLARQKGANVRVQSFIPGKEKYWKVPKEQREQLRKLLRED